MKPIVSDYPLSGSQEQHLARLFYSSSSDGPSRIVASRITYDGRSEFGWLVVFNPKKDWCEYRMFSVSTTDERGLLLFDNCHKEIDKLTVGDADADGFCERGGCREINVDIHGCCDEDTEEFLRALAVTVVMASRMARHEGDGA